MGKRYYMVDSIKGGCGKTTFSIMLAQFLQKKNQDKSVEDRVCLLDFDFLGTGLVSLFFGKSENIKKNLLQDHEYITKIIRKFDKGSDKKYLYDCTIAETPFLVGFGDPDYRRKESYYISSKLNYTPVTHYEIFRNGIGQILKSGFENQTDKTVESIVLDMSPGMDAYSQMVKNCLFDKRYSNVLDTDDERYYFLMTGIDNSQLYAAANYLQEFIERADKCPNRIFIVLNDWVGEAKDENERKNFYEAWIEEFKRYVHIPDRDFDKVCFLIPHYFEKYWSWIHERNALVEATEREGIFLDTPFRYWKMWEDREVKEVQAEDCKEEYTGEEKKGALLKLLMK